MVCGLYLGAIPASAAFFASLSEFDLGGLLAAAIRRHRQPDRYLPGGGHCARGYRLVTDRDHATTATSRDLGQLDLDALWDRP